MILYIALSFKNLPDINTIGSVTCACGDVKSHWICDMHLCHDSAATYNTVSYWSCLYSSCCMFV